jgi:hypothetical protein
MNIVIYKYGELVFEAEYIEDTVDGMIVKHIGETKRLIMDKDYNFSHDVSDEHFGVLYTNKDGHIESKLISTSLKELYAHSFSDIPTYYELEKWTKRVDEQVEKV